MNILAMDPVKHAIRAATKKIMPSVDEMRRDLQAANDPVAVRLLHHIDAISNDLDKASWQQRHVQDYGVFAVWVMMKDTAYYQPLQALMARILLDAPGLLSGLNVQPSEEWYANLHHPAKALTAQMRAKGLLEADEFSTYDEDFRNIRT